MKYVSEKLTAANLPTEYTRKRAELLLASAAPKSFLTHIFTGTRPKSEAHAIELLTEWLKLPTAEPKKLF